MYKITNNEGKVYNTFNDFLEADKYIHSLALGSERILHWHHGDSKDKSILIKAIVCLSRDEIGHLNSIIYEMWKEN